MTTPIRDLLATLPSGAQDAALKDDELQAYLKKFCDREADRRREKDHLLRDALFHDGGLAQVAAKVDELFESREVRERVKRMLPIARFSNATKLIVGQLSTVYAEPATRTVSGEEDQARYDSLLDAMCFDEEMEHVNQEFNLHRALWIGPRVRVSNDKHEVVLVTHSAATARVVMHPNDNTLVVGLLTRCEMRSVRGAYDSPAAWLLTTAHEWELLDKDFRPIPGTWVAHELGEKPWIPVSSAKKATPDFWPGDDGEDLVACHVTSLVVDSLMIKETNTATRQPVITGDTSTMARQQAIDSAGFLEAPEGTSITSIEIGTDIDTFLKADDHTLGRGGNNYGLSMSVLKHEGAASAQARELELAPVRERRRKQVKIFRRVERRLVQMISSVIAVQAPESDLGFSVEGWGIDFAETQMMLTEQERIANYREKKALGFTSPIEFMMSENPDLDREGAWERLRQNVEDCTALQVMIRPLQAISGSLGVEIPDPSAQDPEIASRGIAEARLAQDSTLAAAAAQELSE